MSSIQRERTAQHILGDPGAVIGGEKSLNGREKKIRTKKSQEREEELLRMQV